MPGFDGEEQLQKLLASPPKPPAELKGEVKRGVMSGKTGMAYITKRNAWVEQIIQAGGDLQQASAALHKVGHPIKANALLNQRRKAGHYVREPKLTKAAAPSGLTKGQVAQIAQLIDDVATQRVKPLQDEIDRLRPFEKKYNALKKLLGEDKS